MGKEHVKDIRIEGPKPPSDDFETAIFSAEIGECPGIDLHGLSADSALHELDSFMHQELMRGSEVIKIIHGRGEQVLRRAVHSWLEEQKRLDLVALYRDAQSPGQQNAVTYAALHRLK
ncbi:MAG: Smr/MutS family protein [Patescibacteria group bacterium]|nr:Smr/MutS family protein [Patescibacteria group bacterium]